MRRIDQIIIRPLVTEKATIASEENNTFAFEVGRETTKLEIK